MTTLFDTGSITSDAMLSDCGCYRYWLTRTWDSSKPVICWCMLNPSTATAEQDDPTIRRCMGFTRAWGGGGIAVVNLFAFRSTSPAELYNRGSAAIAPGGTAGEHPLYANANDAHIIFAGDTRRLIAAWGTHGCLIGRDRAVMELLANRRVECLGVTKDGHPKHPLYVAADTQPIRFDPVTAAAVAIGGIK